MAATTVAIPSGSPATKPANIRAISVERERERRHAAPVDRRGRARAPRAPRRRRGSPAGAGAPPAGIPWSSQPRSRQRRRKPACLPEQLCLRREPCSAPHSRSSVAAPARARGARGPPRAARAGPRARRRRSRARPAAGRTARAAAPGAASPRSARTRRGPGRPRPRRPRRPGRRPRAPGGATRRCPRGSRLH